MFLWPQRQPDRQIYQKPTLFQSGRRRYVITRSLSLHWRRSKKHETRLCLVDSYYHGCYRCGYRIVSRREILGNPRIPGGVTYGVCVATETGKQAGLLTQSETDQLLKQIKARAGSDFNLKPEQIEEFAKKLSRHPRKSEIGPFGKKLDGRYSTIVNKSSDRCKASN